MSTIEGNRAVAHIAPVQCLTPADAAAAALSVRERRRAFFFKAEPPRVAEAPRPVKAEKPKVVPPSMSVGASFLYVPDMRSEITAEVTFSDLPWVYKIDDILRAMCCVSSLSRAEILGPRRTNGVAVPRQLTMMLCKLLTARSLPEIGRRLGGKDHTTVLHAARKYQWMVPILKAKIPKGSPVTVYAEAAWQLHLAGQDSVAA